MPDHRFEGWWRREMQPRLTGAGRLAKILAREAWNGALASKNSGEATRWCYRCNQHHPLDQFTQAHPDFPTRDGYNYACNACRPPWRYAKGRTDGGRVVLTFYPD